MSLAFSTKAGTLALLKGLLRSARIAPLVYFTVTEWRTARADCLAQVVSVLGTDPWIVRSGVAVSHVINTCLPYRVINWLEGAHVAADLAAGCFVDSRSTC